MTTTMIQARETNVGCQPIIYYTVTFNCCRTVTESRMDLADGILSCDSCNHELAVKCLVLEASINQPIKTDDISRFGVTWRNMSPAKYRNKRLASSITQSRNRNMYLPRTKGRQWYVHATLKHTLKAIRNSVPANKLRRYNILHPIYSYTVHSLF